MGGVRRAVVIGVNEYSNGKIENLSGAARDATEIRDILRDNGDFVIDDNHFLIDGRASADNIRTAISDLFWKTEECEIALFYFSGHGKRDHFGQGYLLAHDADHLAPLVKGIRIQEIKELFLRSEAKQTGIMILDCCYSGIATEKGGGSEDSDHIKGFREELRLENGGRGRFILASAGAEKAAREEEQQHADGNKHVHGLFSFQLIEGLNVGNGGGIKDEYSRVSLDSLIRHVDGAFKQDDPHRPQFSIGSANGLDSIYLTYMQSALRDRRDKDLAVVRMLIEQNTPRAIIAAIQILKELDARGLGCGECDECHGQVARLVIGLQGMVYRWWMKNSSWIYRQSPASRYYDLVHQTLVRFEIGTLEQLSETEMNFIGQIVEGIKADRRRDEIANDIILLDKNSNDTVEGRPAGNTGMAPTVSPNAKLGRPPSQSPAPG